MNKQVPSLGKILVMVGFALSCFGLLLFLWLAFGGATPLKPKGYQFKVSFGEATQLAHEADVRISGVPVGKVKDIETNQRTGRSDATIQLDPEYAPLPSDAQGDPAPEDAAGRDLRRADARARQGASRSPTTGACATGQVADTVELDEILRTFDPETRRAFQTWIQTQAQSLDGRGQDLNAALGNLAPFAEDTTKLLEILNGQKAGVRQLVRNTGDGLRRAQRARRPARRRHHQLQPGLRDDRGARRRAAGHVQGAADVREGVARRRSSACRSSRPTPTRSSPTCGRRPRSCSPTLEQLSALAPDLKHLFRSIDPLVKASKKGLPATDGVPRPAAPAAGELRRAAGAAQPDPRRRRPVQERAQRVLRQLDGGDAGDDAGRRAPARPCTTCARPTR